MYRFIIKETFNLLNLNYQFYNIVIFLFSENKGSYYCLTILKQIHQLSFVFCYSLLFIIIDDRDLFSKKDIVQGR